MSSSLSPLAGKGGQRLRKESISLASTCSSKSTRTTRPSSSEGKTRRASEASHALDDRVYWDPPLQSQVVGSIKKLKITSPEGSAEAQPGVPLSGIIHRLPSESVPEPRDGPWGHRAKEPRKRKKSLQEDPPSAGTAARPHPTNPSVPRPSKDALIQALMAKMASKRQLSPPKPPAAHRSNNCSKAKKTTASHRASPRPSTASPSVPTKTTSLANRTNPRPSNASSSHARPTKQS